MYPRPRRVGVGPLPQEERREVLLAAHRRHHEGAVAVGRAVVHVRPRRQQGPRRLDVSVPGREQQRREPAGLEPRRPLGARGAALAGPAELRHRPGPRVHRGAVLDQHPGRGGLTVGRRPHQRRLPPRRLRGVDIDAVREERPHRPRVARVGAPHEQGLARPEPEVGIGAGREQPVHGAGVTIRAGRPQRRRSVVVPRVHVRAGPNQARERVRLVPVRRPVQRCRPVGLPGVDVRTLGDERRDRRPVPRLGRVREPGVRPGGGAGRRDTPERDGQDDPGRARPPAPAAPGNAFVRTMQLLA